MNNLTSARVGGKVAIVTGAANGMGRAHAHALSREGASVVLTDRDGTAGAESEDQIRRRGGKAMFIEHDVASEASWALVVERCVSAFGKPTTLVNNAGVYIVKSLVDMSLEDWNFVLDVNLRGTFLGCRSVVPLMKQANGGSIINVSSTFGLVGQRGFSAYCASKGGVRLFSKALAVELAQWNIRVNSVHPGTVETAMTRPLMKDQAAVDALLGAQPIRRVAQPEEIAGAIVFLASEESCYMTGAEIVIDGGYVAV